MIKDSEKKLQIIEKIRLSSIEFFRQDIVILAIIFIMGIAFRLYTLNVVFFGDEHHTVRTALCYPFSYVISHNAGSFFYTIIVYFLLPLGSMEIVSRLPAFIFGILGIYAIYSTAKLFFGRKEALFAASYLAFSPFHIYWSQFARGYSAYLLFSLLSLFFFLKSIKENNIKFWFGYVVFSILQIYAHLFGLLCLPVHILFIGVLIGCKLIKSKVLWSIDKERILRFAVSIILIGVVVFVLYLPDIKASGGIERIALEKVGGVSWPLGTYFVAFGKIIFQAFSWKTQSWNLNNSFSILIYFFFILGIIASLKKFKSQIILTFLYITVPVILFLSSKPLDTAIRNAPDRYFIFFLPFFFFLISKGVSAFWSFAVNSYFKIFKREVSFNTLLRHVSIGMFITFLIFIGFLIPQINEIYQYRINLPDSRGSLQYINKYIQNDDIVVLEGSFLDFFNHSNIKKLFPIYIDDYYKKNIFVINKYDILKKLKGIMNQKRQLWGIVYAPDKDVVEKRLDSINIKKFRKISVVRFDRDILLKNLTRLLDTFYILRENDREVYHLILTKIYLLEKDVDKAKQEIQILKHIDSFDLINKKKLTHMQRYSTLRKGAQIYKKISSAFFSMGEYKESFFSYIKYASFLESINKIDVAVENIERFITYSINTEEKNRLVTQFMDLLPFQEGIYFLWQDPEGWHIRWRGKKGTKFQGKIVSSLKISSLKRFQFREKDQYSYSNHFIKFNSISPNEKVCGLDFQVLNDSELKFDLLINEKRIAKRILIAGQRETPERIPFSMKSYTWK
jgi:hypothetical protein